MKFLITLIILLTSILALVQETFEQDPSKARFITSDIPNFWAAFDSIEVVKNPFKEYINNGSKGLQDFIKYRIESPKNLLKTVKQRRSDYESIRENSYRIENQTQQIRGYYRVFKDLYQDARFPPTYFVIGAYNSGGTSSANGLIIGVEMQKNVEDIPYIVAHELIHFNQYYDVEKNTLLSQSIKEGSADFVGELISGKHINEEANLYGDANEELLCAEFVGIMNDSNYHGWLYGSKGKREGRPNDLGYWIGYKICKAYYDKSIDKAKAIHDILNIDDEMDFLNQSGYLSDYLE